MTDHPLPIPDPDQPYPRPNDKTIIHLKQFITRDSISVGDFTIYHDFVAPETFEQRNVLYDYPINPDRLIIGKFCSIACGAKFLMNGANHTLKSLSTYPFAVLGAQWDPSIKVAENWDQRGDIVIGNDVWIGYEAVVLSGVTIGDGAIIGSRSVVTKDVPPYGIVGGVPARLLRKRFSEPVIDALLTLHWWDWEPSRIQRNLDAIRHGDVDALAKG